MKTASSHLTAWQLVVWLPMTELATRAVDSKDNLRSLCRAGDDPVTTVTLTLTSQAAADESFQLSHLPALAQSNNAAVRIHPNHSPDPHPSPNTLRASVISGNVEHTLT